MADIKAIPPNVPVSDEIEDALEKPNLDLAEVDRMLVDQERAPEARGATLETIPSNYWYSWNFIGTFVAIILAKDAGSGGFSLAAPVLANINADIGPDPDIAWVSLSWILTQGISALLVGRLSDIFGRRWIFVGASIVGTAGAIWASQAQSVQHLIGATVLLGVAGGVQISYFWTISEIVPMKWRFAANALIYACSFTTWIGPKISYDFQTGTSVHWRGCYYLLIGLNGTSTICWYLFYHPPTFKMLHRGSPLKLLIKSFDWLGLAIFAGSFISFLIGLNWGGNRYPWKSVEVLAPLLCGVAGLAAFVTYEIWLPSFSKDTIPFVEKHFFTNVQLLAITGMTGVAASTYYGVSSVWPGLVTNVYTGLNHDETGNQLSLLVLCYLWAQALGGLIAHFTGPKKPIIISMFIAAPILACMAIDPFNRTLTSVLIGLGGFALGIMEGVALTATTYPLRTQEEIGTAGGVTGTIRLFISTIATAVYNSTLVNRLNTSIPNNVSPAAIAAGLPASSVPQLITGLRGRLTLNSTTVPGIDEAIEDAARLALRAAYSQAYRTVFLVCIAFTAPGLILCWFVANTDKKKETFIAGHLHQRQDEKKLEQDEG